MPINPEDRISNGIIYAFPTSALPWEKANLILPYFLRYIIRQENFEAGYATPKQGHQELTGNIVTVIKRKAAKTAYFEKRGGPLNTEYIDRRSNNLI